MFSFGTRPCVFGGQAFTFSWALVLTGEDDDKLAT